MLESGSPAIKTVDGKVGTFGLILINVAALNRELLFGNTWLDSDH